jgi:parallel beta-helix repeat protein
MYFSLSSNNAITQNYFKGNTYGINLVQSANNRFTENTFTENHGGALRISDSYNNTFGHNNFINYTIETQILMRWFQAAQYETNIWDNGAEGNYWSNMNERYPNSTQITLKNVLNTAFYIDTANVDHYPLVGMHTAGTDGPIDFPEGFSPSQLEDKPLFFTKFDYIWLIVVSLAFAVACIGIALTYRRLKNRVSSA